MLTKLVLGLLLSFGSAVALAQQSAECLPKTKESEKWPVKAIYMHGLFKGPNGPDTNGFRALEAGNRKKLAEYAEKMKIRIAVPVAPDNGMWRNWNGVGIKKVEEQAKAACGNALLAEPRALIGFSNGGYVSRGYAMNCASTRAYGVIMSIGAPNNVRQGNCGETKHINTAPHVMPDFSYFEKNMASLSKGSGSSSGGTKAGGRP